MKQLYFDKSVFFKTIAIFIGATVFWSVLCFQTKEFNARYDKGLITSTGLFFCLPISIFLGQRTKQIRILARLILFTILVFSISSFILLPLIGRFTESIASYCIINSLLVPVTLVFLFNQIIPIEFKTGVSIIGSLLLATAYYLIYMYNKTLFLNYDIPLSITLIAVFQFCLIVPMSLGMTLKTSKAL